MKIFVGTMYSGENEFEDSSKSIFSQEDVDITRYVVSFKNEHEAAKDLYGTWESVKKDYDFFIQVDPDTVLRHSRVFFDACSIIKESNQYNFVQCPLYDHFTDSHIWGLNVYSPEVVFDTAGMNSLYTDRCTSNKRPLNIDEKFPSLYPAGDHAPNPSDMQAFRFGVHRGLKNQIGNLDKVIISNKANATRAKWFAIVGFKNCQFFKNAYNYEDLELQDAVKQIADDYSNPGGKHERFHSRQR